MARGKAWMQRELRSREATQALGHQRPPCQSGNMRGAPALSILPFFGPGSSGAARSLHQTHLGSHP